MRYLLVALFALVGCNTSTISTTSTTSTALEKWGNAPVLNAETYDYYAAYDYLGFTSTAFPAAGLDSLRARNPDIKIGIYFSVHTAQMWTSRAQLGTYNRALWDALSPRYLRTTTGDTACLWQNDPLYDFTDPAVRLAAVSLLTGFVNENGVDLVFLDFFSSTLPDLKKFQAPVYSANEEGEWDFDQNGIPYLQDTGERLAIIEAQFAYMRELSAALPATFLIANGNLAIMNPAFTQLLDGIFLEQFPWYNWGGEGPHMGNAMDPDYPNSLPQLVAREFRTSRGLVFIENEFNAPNYNVIAALFDNIVECRHMKGDVFPPMPQRLMLTMPAPVTHDERTWRRATADTIYTFRY